MKILDIAKKSKISFSKIRYIAQEFDESIEGMTKNVAQLHLINTLEKMMIYGDLYVYEGRYPTEEPEIVKMDIKLLNNARCLGRIRHEQLLCNTYPEITFNELISKTHFYHIFSEAYDKYIFEGEAIEVFAIVRKLISGHHVNMKDNEYKEWKYFIHYYKL